MNTFESKIVESAIADLQAAFGEKVATDLEHKRESAGTSLEFYGLTKTFLEKLIVEYRLSGSLRESVSDAIRAIEVMYGSRGILIYKCTVFPKHILRQVQRHKRSKYVERS